MPPIYRHRQTSTLFRIATAVVGLLAVIAFATNGFPIRGGGIVIGLLIAGALSVFTSLTVEVTSERVAFWFGPGVLEHSYRVDRIRAAAAVRNHWIWGWGIRWTPRGWLYNVEGLDAVELTLDDGKRLRIGTDEPRRLAAAIAEARGSRRRGR